MSTILTDEDGRQFRNVARNPKADDKRYIASGSWKCPGSPTGAHHKVTITRDDGVTEWICKYCPMTWEYEPIPVGVVFKDFLPIVD